MSEVPLYLGPYGSPGEGAVSYEQGTFVSGVGVSLEAGEDDKDGVIIIFARSDCESHCNTYSGCPWSPFSLRRAHPGPGSRTDAWQRGPLCKPALSSRERLFD